MSPRKSKAAAAEEQIEMPVQKCGWRQTRRAR